MSIDLTLNPLTNSSVISIVLLSPSSEFFISEFYTLWFKISIVSISLLLISSFLTTVLLPSGI